MRSGSRIRPPEAEPLYVLFGALFGQYNSTGFLDSATFDVSQTSPFLTVVEI